MIDAGDRFNQVSQGAIRPLDWRLEISMTKERDDQTNWFTLNESYLDGADILAQEGGQAIQLWDYYKYDDMSRRVMGLDITRSIAFPYNVQSAILDMTLDNHDGALTVEGDGIWSDYILPKRPTRASLGFKEAGLVAQFVGMTDKIPKYNGIHNQSITWTANDFLSEIGENQLRESIILENVTTGEAIRTILEQYGMEPQMIDIDPGINVIPFLYLNKDRKAGPALLDLVQAENGKLWLSETGVIKFRPGTDEIDNFPVMTFDDTNIVECTPSQTDNIVNHVNIKSNIRQVLDLRSIYDQDNQFNREEWDSSPFFVDAGETKTIWVNLSDPALNIDTNFANNATGRSNFKAVYPGTEAQVYGTGISAVATAFIESVKIEFTNNVQPAMPVVISHIEVFGRPAPVVDEVNYDAFAETSVERFDEQTLSITNDFMGSRQNIERVAREILLLRAKYNPTMTLVVKGNPALELGDNVQVFRGDGGGDYKVIGSRQTLNERGLTTTLTLERIELLRTFTLNVSQLDSSADRLG